MNQHIEHWIDAYFDGELNPNQVRKFEKHLESCPECLARLEERESLSVLLQSAAMPEPVRDAEQFVHDVTLLLPREQDAPKRNALNAIWYLVPLFVLGSAVFMQAVNWISNILLFTPGLEKVVDVTLLIPSKVTAAPSWLDIFFTRFVSFSGFGIGIASLRFTTLAVMILLVLIYISWMGFWFAAQENKQ